MSRWLIASILWVGLWGCRSHKSSAGSLELISPLSWTDAGSRFLERLRVSPDALETAFRKQLKQNKRIRWTRNQRPQIGRYSALLSMHLRFAHDIGGGVSEDPKSRMHLVLEIELLPSTRQDQRLRFREERSALYDTSTPPPLGKIRDWTRELVVMGARSLRTRLDLQKSSTSELLGYLKNGSSLQQRQAAALLGRRGERRAIPLLLGHLSGKEDPKDLAIIGALVQLKAEEAVIPLIKLAPHASSVFLQQLVSALAVLGGWHAEGFLAMLSSAHQNQQVRQSAREAFEELRQKQQRLLDKAPRVAISPLTKKERLGH
ncbi:MAG: hypothetical protein H6728_07970 [Myxococcales bacterium]|nr:hypothetical protein [Myxococcales bacterium]MCB9642994.1 hypothetical protein [Myxococcales bacterium]